MAIRFGKTREWVGGVRALSTPVTGEGEPYRPLGLLWLDPKAKIILGLSAEHPDEGLAYAADNLLQVIDDPMAGKPGRPTRIRTASGALAEALANGLAGTRPRIEIVVAPTPEIDDAFDQLEASFGIRDTKAGPPDAVAAQARGTGGSDASGSGRGEPRDRPARRPVRDGTGEPPRPREAAELIDALRASPPRGTSGGLDLEEAQDLTDALLEHFRAAPEAAPFEQPLEGPELLAQIAAIHLDTTLPALTGRGLDEALLEIAPRHVAGPPAIARNVVETTRALFVWLGREHALEQADELIELLGEDAVRELERHLGTSIGTSPVEVIAEEMLSAGVDPADPKAVDDFMMSRIGMRPRVGDDDLFGDFDGFPPPSAEPPLTPEQRRDRQKKRKGNRKAARKARKKNR